MNSLIFRQYHERSCVLDTRNRSKAGSEPVLGKLYTEVPTRTGATWKNKVPRMFSGVQDTTGIEQKCL